jgi:hypothetical protein
MRFEIQWDYAAERVLLHRVEDWKVASDVAMGLHRWVAQWAPRLPSERYAFTVAGYHLAVRLDREAGTVCVLALYRLR